MALVQLSVELAREVPLVPFLPMACQYEVTRFLDCLQWSADLIVCHIKLDCSSYKHMILESETSG